MINSPKTNENRTISMNKKLSDIMKEFKQYRMSFTDFEESCFFFWRFVILFSNNL